MMAIAIFDLLTTVLITDMTPCPLVGTELSELLAACIFEAVEAVHRLKVGGSNPFRNVGSYILICTLVYDRRLETSTRQRWLLSQASTT
jgi:hypothetical protein